MKKVAVAGGFKEELIDLANRINEEWQEDVILHCFDSSGDYDISNCSNIVFHETAPDQSVLAAVESVARGEADILLKGDTQTRTLLKEVLNKEHGLLNQSILSHTTLVDLPKLSRPLILSDAAMIIDPSEDELEQIVLNAIRVAHQIGLERPKVALLSSAETLNPKMPSSVKANALMERFASKDDAIVYGPISLDIALSPEAAEQKHFTGPIQGDADILIVPQIDVGNVLYKSLTLFGGATMGGTIVGTKVPIVLTSRSDHLNSKLYALKFALMQVSGKENQ